MGNTPSCLCSALGAASATTLLSMCISHCVPAYSLVVPSPPMNTNTNINSLLANYPSAGVEQMEGNKDKDVKLTTGASPEQLSQHCRGRRSNGQGLGKCAVRAL